MMQHPFSQARWVWSADAGDPRFAVRRFRGAFALDAAQTVTLHVSADSRYTLSCDGALLGRGPARSDLRHYVYESYTLTLAPGRHVLAASVSAARGAAAPLAEMHDRGAFLLQAEATDGTVLLATGGDAWRVQSDTAFQPIPLGRHDGYYAVGMAEQVDAARFPHGWERGDFEDSGWETPVAIETPFLRGAPGDPGGSWRLLPRDIPHLHEQPRRFAAARLRTGDEGEWRGEAALPLTVPPHTHWEVLFDPGEYVNGYPVLETDGGAGATVRIVYAEALTRDGRKGVRDDRENTDVAGFFDVYKPGGGQQRYSPLHWRAFRFVKLVLEAGAAPLTVTDFSYLLTGYPWRRQAAFTVADGPEALATVQDVDFRTLERCTAETFMDCPYYEQLQYVGDTRLQALLSYVTTGDTRLGARAVRLFDWSRLPDGLTQSRYPSSQEQIIPPFSLLWVLMVEDLYRYAAGEVQTVADCLPGCRGVLEWFGRHLTPDGVLGALPWWSFVDWADGWESGVPPPAAAGLPSATINLQYLAALQAYIRLQNALGDTRESEFWQAEADMLADSISLTFWDPDARLLREGPEDRWGVTQHAQAWGILTGVIAEADIADVVDSLHEDDTLTQATYYHTFYVVEALAKASRLERLWDHWLAPWRDALALHLTTWPEQPEPTRSDCHAWSAWPTYAFLTHVLGVRPTQPGFGTWEITPRHIAGWDQVSGALPIPDGLLTVTVEWSPEGRPHVDSIVR